MNRHSQVISALLLAIMAGCISYDSPVIYHKNFQPGTHDSLRFDGYYAPEIDWKLYGRSKAMFLYRNGSVWTAEQIAGSADLSADPNAIKHSWGNYKVEGDTIYIERFHREQDSDNYNRIIMKGVVRSQRIDWLQRTDGNLNPDSVYYGSVFIALDKKPDSTQNWTRTRPQYNK